MDKNIYIFAAIILILAAIGLLIYNVFEIYPEKRTVYPSREIYNNSYIALERWLEKTGRTTSYNRYFKPSELSETNTKVAIIHSWIQDWDIIEEMDTWIKQGGFLVVCLGNTELDSNLLAFLTDYGITVLRNASSETEPNDNSPEPDFDWHISFTVEKEESLFLIKDNTGHIRLVEIPIGKGKLTVTGRPYFMYNYRISEDINANLSWRLTGERTKEGDDVFFMRTQANYVQKKSIFGPIFERGNLIPIGISALVLIIIGFWSVIPTFGLVFEEKQRISRPIKDRFKAEIGFLKKYKTLDYYLNTDKKEENKIYNYRELINHYRSKLNETKN